MPLFTSWELQEAARRAGKTERAFVEDACPHATENGIDNELTLACAGKPSQPVRLAMQQQLQKQS